MKRDETFSESVELYRVPDLDFYHATGVNALERAEAWRAVYRLRLDLKSGAVHSQLLATVNARLVEWLVHEDGTRTGVFGARGRNGHRFIFRLKEKDFQNTRAIGKAVYGAAPIGCFIVPGCALAFMRAVLQLSQAGELMPLSPDEMAALTGPAPDEEEDSSDDESSEWVW